jgi:hypothetical protein
LRNKLIKNEKEDVHYSDTLIKDLISSNENWVPSFNKDKHDSESRLSITKLVLTWYFKLISGFFIKSLVFNIIMIFAGKENQALDVFKTVKIITTSLSGGVVFL